MSIFFSHAALSVQAAARSASEISRWATEALEPLGLEAFAVEDLIDAAQGFFGFGAVGELFGDVDAHAAAFFPAVAEESRDGVREGAEGDGRLAEDEAGLDVWRNFGTEFAEEADFWSFEVHVLKS